MKRVFVGVKVTQATADILFGAQKGLEGVRLVPYDNFHLTLRFIGDATEAQLETLHKLLLELEYEEFALQLEGVGFFPLRGAPLNLWAGLQCSTELLRLQSILEGKCRAAGFTGESRKYHPHITLGRVIQYGSDVTSWLSSNSLLTSKSFKVDQFALFQSILNPSGAVYHELFSYPLAVNHELREYLEEEELL